MVFNSAGYQQAIENEFTIVNKDRLEVPFILNKAQDDIIHQLESRNVILKCRKLGFSSLMLAIGALKFLLGENERVVSMSFDSDASVKQLERAKRFIESFERKNNITIPKKYNSKNEMVYERVVNGVKYINTFRIGTANSESFGRGDDISFLHLTEVSLADNIENLLAGVGEATINDAMITLETTANGFNNFKSFYDEAVLGERGYKTFFYNPTWEYTPEFLEQKKKELGRLYPQEYPMTALEAFLTSGDTFFDMLALKEYIQRVKEPMTCDLIY